MTSSSLASEIIYGSVEIWIFCAAEQRDALVWHHERDDSFLGFRHEEMEIQIRSEIVRY